MANDKFTFTKPVFGSSPAKFLKEVRTELGKVVWPTRKEALNLTLMVIIISVIVGVYIGSLDYVFTKVMDLLLRR